MLPSIRLMGDALPALTLLARDLDSAGPPSSVLVAVDLSDVVSRHDLKERLRHALESSALAVRHEPTVRHVFLIYSAEPRVEPRLERIVSSLLTHAHVADERERARDVEYTAVDVTDCINPEVLADRIREHAKNPRATHDVVLLDWSDIAGQSVAAAARQMAC